MEVLSERIEDEPDRLSNRELKDIMDTAFDRTIAPSKATGKFQIGPNGGAPNVSVSVSFVKSNAKQQEPLAIDITPTDVSDQS